MRVSDLTLTIVSLVSRTVFGQAESSANFRKRDEPVTYSTAQLSDLQCIREVAQRYCRGVDRLDEALMKSAYSILPLIQFISVKVGLKKYC